MADRNVTAAAQHFDAQEAAAEDACARAASAHGLTADQAEQCDDGDQGCPTCPWRKTTAGVPASPAAPHPDCTAPDCDCEPGIECAARGAARGVKGCGNA